MRGSSRAGQATVEFALVITLLMTAMCAIIEFSWVFYNCSHVTHAVEKAARVGVVGGSNDDITAVVVGSPGGLPISRPVIRACKPDGTPLPSSDRTHGNLLTVSASIDYPELSPLSRFVKMASFGQLSASCTVRVE